MTPRLNRKPAEKSNGRRQRLVKRLVKIAGWITGGFFILSIGLVFLFKFVPPLFTPLMVARSLEAREAGRDTQIRYDWTPYERISPDAAIAVVAAEDQRFPQHAGFDWTSIRQALKAGRNRKQTRGASTISQQVAKNVFLWNQRSYFRKGLEAYFTVLIELIWGKQRILEVYLNVAETGDQTFGIPAASARFFGRPAHRISRRQAATLAAILPNPRRFSARRPSPYVRRRANFILQQMRNLGGPAYLKDPLRFQKSAVWVLGAPSRKEVISQKMGSR